MFFLVYNSFSHDPESEVAVVMKEPTAEHQRKHNTKSVEYINCLLIMQILTEVGIVQ